MTSVKRQFWVKILILNINFNQLAFEGQAGLDRRDLTKVRTLLIHRNCLDHGVTRFTTKTLDGQR